MKNFMDENFLLQTETAQKLYHEHAAKMPIIDYHCHLIPQMVADDYKFKSLTEIWLGGDHYKWRAMRTNGVDERYCTGKDTTDWEKFEKWAETVPYTFRNPLYHWTHLELKTAFGIDKILSPKTAREIYDECNEKLAQPEYSARGMMRRYHVEVVCTTDDPIDSLEYHIQTRESGFENKMLPTWRPDKAMAVEVPADIRAYVHTLLNSEYSIIEAADGTEGIRKAMKYVPDVIISDVMMPGIDGIECCRRLKGELQTCHIPVILLTACSLDEQRIQGYAGGADSYISKPFSSQLLLTRIRNLIESRQRMKQFFGDRQTLAKEDICDMDKDFVERFKSLIEVKMGDSELNVEDLGKEMGLSRVQLYRKIKSLTNYAPNELLRMARLKKAASLLASSDMTIAEVGYEVGFTSPSYFAKCYKEQFGESPTEFLKRSGL